MANFDQYMAESGQQSTLDQLRRDFKYDEAKGQFSSQGYYGSGPNSPGYATRQAADNAARALEESRLRARGELEGVRPKIAEIYKSKEATIRGEIEPTKQRYDALLEEVTRRQQEEETRGTLATGRELGRRGITAESGLGERTMNEMLSPISRYYTGQAKDVGFEQEGALRQLQALISGLGEQEAQQNIGISQQLANIESTYGGNAASVALQQAQMNATATQNTLANELAKQEQALAERQQSFLETNTFTDLEQQKLIAEIAKMNRTSTGGAGTATPTASSIIDDYPLTYGTGTNTPFGFVNQATPSFTPIQ